MEGADVREGTDVRVANVLYMEGADVQEGTDVRVANVLYMEEVHMSGRADVRGQKSYIWRGHMSGGQTSD